MLMLSDKIKPLRCIGNLTGMLFYKVSSNHPGVGMERRRESKNIKVLVVCRTVQTVVKDWQKGDVVLRSRIKPL